MCLYILLLVDGKWSTWGDYGECDKTCGEGRMIRKRKCDNPPLSLDGKDCVGSDEDEKPCNIKSCPGINILTLFIFHNVFGYG